MGDGYMVAFKSAAGALRCAIAMQQGFASNTEVRVRIGLHTGPVVREHDDFYGRTVNYAARVASSALGGEIAVSADLRRMLDGQFAFDEGRAVELKGFGGEHRVFLVAGQQPG